MVDTEPAHHIFEILAFAEMAQQNFNFMLCFKNIRLCFIV
jgi:hypothetical protein